ncbi:MAG: hypothetical protein HUK05_06750, partial [Prevotella sp.]|nr:hypothetical protein [Prevotella sp.]
GSLQLAKSNGYVVFYNEKGIEKIDFFLARTGSMSGKVLGSKDGVNFTEIQSYSGSKGTKELSVSTIFSIDGYKYIKLTNAATGSLHVQGVRLFEPAEATAINSQPSIVNSQPSKIYNLRGQRLSKINHSGIYIINGKKAIVR